MDRSANLSQLDARDATLIPAFILIVLHIVAPLFLVLSEYWRQISLGNRFLIALFCVISPPFLFSMERGNLIILAFFLMPMIFSKNSILKSVGIALAINVKPYFAALLLGFLMLREWRLLVATAAIAGSIFIFSGLLSDPNFLLFIPNLLNFSQNDAILSGREVIAFPSSVSALTFVINLALKNSTDPGAAIPLLSSLAILIETVKWLSISYLIAGILAARDKITADEASVAMILLVINMGIWAGGYSQIFLMACVPLFFAMHYRLFFSILLFIVFLPSDCIILFSEYLGMIFSFVSGSIVDLDWQFGLGSLIRPTANLALAVGLGTEFLMRNSRPKHASLIRYVEAKA